MTKEKDGKDVSETRSHDTRIMERNLKRGLITRKEYEKYLKSLPDVKDKVKPPSE